MGCTKVDQRCEQGRQYPLYLSAPGWQRYLQSMYRVSVSVYRKIQGDSESSFLLNLLPKHHFKIAMIAFQNCLP